jgi:hypothetical protein
VTRALSAGVRYFLAVFAIGFALGTLRAIVVVPRIGETAAVLLELPLMLAAAWLVCGYLLRRCPLAFRERALMGAMAFTLLMIAEAALSMLMFHRSLADHLALYAETPNLLGLVGQVLFGLFPLMRGRS